MMAFDVRDMYSSRSAGAIVKSVKALDGAAHVRVDLASHSVEIETDHAQLQDLSDAIGPRGTPALPELKRASSRARWKPRSARARRP